MITFSLTGQTTLLFLHNASWNRIYGAAGKRKYSSLVMLRSSLLRSVCSGGKIVLSNTRWFGSSGPFVDDSAPKLVYDIYAGMLYRAFPPISDYVIRGLQNFLDSFEKITVITGAGISTDSGIPDYRSETFGRLTTSKYMPITYQQFMKSRSARKRFWARSFVGWPNFCAHRPNVSHETLVSWESSGRLQTIITQNVDRLHHKAGSKNVIELHGNLFSVRCMDCDVRLPRDEVQNRLTETNSVWLAETFVSVMPDGDVELSADKTESFNEPMCTSCGGILKPDVVFFGDNVPCSIVDAATESVAKCDALLVLGTTCEAFSVYRLIVRAIEEGKSYAVVNIGQTRVDAYVDVKVEGPLAQVLPKLEVY